jgi:hypothetical protein
MTSIVFVFRRQGSRTGAEKTDARIIKAREA